MSRRGILFALAVVIVAVASPPALAARHIYLELEGSVTGPIQGDVVANQYEDQIEVLEFHHLLRDPAAKTVEHEEIVFTVDVGKWTPQMAEAWDTGEVLSTCTFRFLRGGANEHYLTVEALQGKIAAIEPISAPAQPLVPPIEDRVRVRVYYAQLRVVDEIDGPSVIVPNPQHP